MKKIEKAIKLLLNHHPFYAHFFLNSKIVYDKYNVGTAGAAITPTGVIMAFDTKFVESLTYEEVAAVIEHEVLHILFDHISTMKHDPLIDKHVSNIAMDCSINQYIQSLPKGCVTLDVVNKITKKKLNAHENWEYYYGHLMQVKNKMQGTKNHDNHEMNVPDQCKPGEGKQVLRSAMDTAIKASKGNVPSHVMKVLDGLNPDSQLPWKQILANFVASAASSVSRNTRKKINRRYGTDQPGKKKHRELTLGVCTDSSGSVSDDSYQKFMGEIVRIAKLCNTVYLVDADCQVQNVEKLTKHSKVKNQRYGNGGTAYQPAIDECLKRQCDAIIYFGDMDAADTPTPPGRPFLWVAVGESPPPANFGTIVRLK